MDDEYQLSSLPTNQSDNIMSYNQTTSSLTNSFYQCSSKRPSSVDTLPMNQGYITLDAPENMQTLNSYYTLRLPNDGAVTHHPYQQQQAQQQFLQPRQRQQNHQQHQHQSLEQLIPGQYPQYNRTPANNEQYCQHPYPQFVDKQSHCIQNHRPSIMDLNENGDFITDSQSDSNQILYQQPSDRVDNDFVRSPFSDFELHSVNQQQRPHQIYLNSPENIAPAHGIPIDTYQTELFYNHSTASSTPISHEHEPIESLESNILLNQSRYVTQTESGLNAQNLDVQESFQYTRPQIQSSFESSEEYIPLTRQSTQHIETSNTSNISDDYSSTRQVQQSSIPNENDGNSSCRRQIMQVTYSPGTDFRNTQMQSYSSASSDRVTSAHHQQQNLYPIDERQSCYKQAPVIRCPQPVINQQCSSQTTDYSSDRTIDNKQDDFVELRSFSSISQDWLDTICKHLIDHMNRFGICVIDNFLGPQKGDLIFDEVLQLYSSGQHARGGLVNSNKLNSRNLSADIGVIRNDRVIWIDGYEEGCSEINNLIQTLCSVITNTVRLSLYSDNGFDKIVINKRTKAHVACYPGSGTRYIKHVDNPNGDGRVITSIYYLNKNWNTKRDGGLLRMFPTGINEVANIEPLFDRVLFFWSDRRNPHEVLPAYRDRFAITVWYIGENRT